jgi:hypothetical protein
MPTKKSKPSAKLIEKSSPRSSESIKSRLPERLVALLEDLNYAIEYRRYTEVERIANDLLDLSPSEESDRFIHDLIGSAVSIIDAEDEIRYQFNDLKSALENTSEEDLATIEETEKDGL